MVRDVTFAIEGSEGVGRRVRPTHPHSPVAMSSTDFEALRLIVNARPGANMIQLSRYGTVNVTPSAYLTNVLPGATQWRSEELIMNMVGPRAEP